MEPLSYMPTHLMLCCMIAMLVCSKPLTEKLGDEGVCDLVEYSIDDAVAIKPYESGANDPPTKLRIESGEQAWFHCCGTGYDRINWYINGSYIDIDNTEKFVVTDNEQVLHWLGVGPAGESTLTCELVKYSPQSNASHTYSIAVPSVCEPSEPRLISYPSNLCAFVGEDLEVECTVDYGPSICSELTFRNFIFSDNDHPLITNMNNVRSERRITLDREGKKMKGRLIFSRLTKQQLQQTYSCTVNTHRYLSVTFRLTDGCQDINDREKEAIFIDWRIGAVMGAFVIALVCGLISFVIYSKCKTFLMILWRSKLHRTWKGDKLYDAFIICSDHEEDKQFLNEKLVDQLEMYYSLWLHDRDSTPGAVIPDQLTHCVKESRRVIVIVGRGNLQAQWCSLSMDLAVAYKVPLIFIGTNKHISMEDQCEDVGISCIQKASFVITYPEVEETFEEEKFYHLLLKEMPPMNTQRLRV